MKYFEEKPLLRKCAFALFSGIILFVMWIFLIATQNITAIDFFMSGCIVLITFYTSTVFYMQLDKYD